MDLNDLYFRHQISLMRADAAACDRSRLAHLELARGYAARIDAERALNVRRTAPPAEA